MKNKIQFLNPILSNNIIKTHEGGKAYKLTLKESIAQFFSLGLLRGTFYSTEDEVLQDARDIFEKAMLICPEFATKAAIYGNNTNSLKLIPMIWLVYLSTMEDKTLFKKAFPQIIKNPTALYKYVQLVRKGNIRTGLGRCNKGVINNWLISNINDYNATRNKSNLSEVINLSRPANNDEDFQKYMHYIMKDILSFDRAKGLDFVKQNLKKDILNEDVLNNIEKYSIQLEEIKALIGGMSSHNKKKVYDSIYRKLSYTSLILNLVAIERVFATKTEKRKTEYCDTEVTYVISHDMPDELVEYIATRIRNVGLYRKANILPFSMLNAYKMTSVEAWKDAISSMFETCANDSFKIDASKKVIVATDMSGSMRMNYVNNHIHAGTVACVLAAMIKKAQSNATVVGISDSCKRIALSNSLPLLDMADKICSHGEWSGTYFQKIMPYYSDEDVIVLITDSEQADDLEMVWLKDKKTGCKLIVWQLTPNFIKVSEHPDVYYVNGYSDRMLLALSKIINDDLGQVDEIEKIII